MSTLSEFASKEILARHGLPILQERVVASSSEVPGVLAQMSLPVVAKLCGPSIAHKTERGLVKLNLQTNDDVSKAVDELLAAAVPADGEVEVLIAPMVKSSREFIAGVVRDAQFGPNVMLGVGGVLAEAIADVVFRPVPLSSHDAHEMVAELRSQKLLGEFRGEPAVSIDALVRVLLALSNVSVERSDIASIDLNPLLVTSTGEVVAVDALVEIEDAFTTPTNQTIASSVLDDEHFSKEEVLGIQTVASLDDIPKDAADLVFVCTPSSANPEILRACARRGIKAAFLTSAGYGEAGDEGIRLEKELISLANELGILLAGPNGQGVVSTPSQLCAQIVAPYPPRGRIGVASQSGNFVSSFLNYSRQSGVGVSRAVSAGNAACVSVADYLKWYSTDTETSVGLAYLEGIFDGSHLMAQLQEVTMKMPLVVMKGGATEAGAKAAASHTGALAANDKVFDGACRQSGISRAKNVEEAFDTAACFATQPLPKGGRTVILTTAGGWGVVTSDALMSTQELTLVDLPEDLKAAIDEKLPPRWSKSNPVDCAGGETRDTIPGVMGLIARHPDIDAVIYLGIGIQSNQARLMQEGKFYPDHGLERIVAYHERQDARFAEAADELIKETGKPILIASELAIADPQNAGPRTVRETDRYCFPSGHRAVAALAHMVRYSTYLTVHQ